MGQPAYIVSFPHSYQKIEADPTFETLLYFQPELKGSVKNSRHNSDPVPSL